MDIDLGSHLLGKPSASGAVENKGLFIFVGKMLGFEKVLI